MMKKEANVQELQELFGKSVQLAERDGYCLAKFDTGLTIGIPFQLPIANDGMLVDPAAPLADDERQNAKTILALPAGIHSFELFPGSFDGAVFWLAQPGDLPTHTLASLYHSPGTLSQEEMYAQTAEFRKNFCPFDSWYLRTENCLAQSQHVIKTPMSLWDTMNLWNMSGFKYQFNKLMWALKPMLSLSAKKPALQAVDNSSNPPAQHH